MQRLIISFGLLFSSTAWAGDAKDMLKAHELGQIVGTAETCGYVLDPEKTAEYVSSFLENTDETSRSFYQNASGAQKLKLGEMTDLERKVACATQEKLAVRYGLTP